MAWRVSRSATLPIKNDVRPLGHGRGLHARRCEPGIASRVNVQSTPRGLDAGADEAEADHSVRAVRVGRLSGSTVAALVNPGVGLVDVAGVVSGQFCSTRSGRQAGGGGALFRNVGASVCALRIGCSTLAGLAALEDAEVRVVDVGVALLIGVQSSLMRPGRWGWGGIRGHPSERRCFSSRSPDRLACRRR